MRANRQRRGLLIAHLAAFCDHGSVVGQTFVLGVGAKVRLQGRCKDLVANFEVLDSAADGFDVTGQLHAEDGLSWFAEP